VAVVDLVVVAAVALAVRSCSWVVWMMSCQNQTYVITSLLLEMLGLPFYLWIVLFWFPMMNKASNQIFI